MQPFHSPYNTPFPVGQSSPSLYRPILESLSAIFTEIQSLINRLQLPDYMTSFTVTSSTRVRWSMSCTFRLRWLPLSLVNIQQQDDWDHQSYSHSNVAVDPLPQSVLPGQSDSSRTRRLYATTGALMLSLVDESCMGWPTIFSKTLVYPYRSDRVLFYDRNETFEFRHVNVTCVPQKTSVFREKAKKCEEVAMIIN